MLPNTPRQHVRTVPEKLALLTCDVVNRDRRFARRLKLGDDDHFCQTVSADVHETLSALLIRFHLLSTLAGQSSFPMLQNRHSANEGDGGG